MLYLNYEEAQSVFERGDILAVRIAARLARVMLSEESRLSLRPQWPFDMRYFYDSIIRSMEEYYKLSITSGLRQMPRIHAKARPDFGQNLWHNYHWVKLGLGATYVNLVERDSISDGIDYDLEFACSIACRAFDVTSIAEIFDRVDAADIYSHDNFDDWLQGFTAQE